jgi:serine-type D-Ala-D-Ala carboxypeptidase
MRPFSSAPAIAIAIATLLVASCARAPRTADVGQRRGADAARAVEAPAGTNLTRGLATADSLIEAAIAKEQMPGAVLLVAKDGKVVRERAYGRAQLYDDGMRRLVAPRPMHTSTLFDLASVTKVMATTNALMLLVDRGLVDVDAPVYRYLPDFRGPHLDSITVRHLLTHSAGLVQWQPLYYRASNKAQTYDVIRQMPLQWGVGEARHYSDLGFMLLGFLVERVSGESLDVFLDRELYTPLGLRTTLWNPKSRGILDVAATEDGNGYEHHMVYDDNFGYLYKGDKTAWNGWRQYVLIGETNDGNSWYANGGVAGHAGLFSTAADLRVLVDLLINRGAYGGHQYIQPRVVDLFLTRDRYGHYLGWQVPADMPPGSFAHNGFTGTYVAGVPSARLSIVLLTNRQNVGTNAQGYFPNVAPLDAAVLQAVVSGDAADVPH